MKVLYKTLYIQVSFLHVHMSKSYPFFKHHLLHEAILNSAVLLSSLISLAEGYLGLLTFHRTG